MLWSTVHAAAWRDGMLEGMRVGEGARDPRQTGRERRRARPKPRAVPLRRRCRRRRGRRRRHDDGREGSGRRREVHPRQGRCRSCAVTSGRSPTPGPRSSTSSRTPSHVIDALLCDIRPAIRSDFSPPSLSATRAAARPGWSAHARPARHRLVVLDAATTTDLGIIGSPRRWASGYPSLPILTVERHGVANPAIIVDEIEKAGRSTAGSIHDPLLSLLEKGTARRWRDQFLDTEVDVSTRELALHRQRLAGIPGPLRNRLRILRMPRPGREHVPVIAAQVLRELLQTRHRRAMGAAAGRGGDRRDPRRRRQRRERARSFRDTSRACWMLGRRAPRETEGRTHAFGRHDQRRFLAR